MENFFSILNKIYIDTAEKKHPNQSGNSKMMANQTPALIP